MQRGRDDDYGIKLHNDKDWFINEIVVGLITGA